jgi:hypothetical protein
VVGRRDRAEVVATLGVIDGATCWPSGETRRPSSSQPAVSVEHLAQRELEAALLARVARSRERLPVAGAQSAASTPSSKARRGAAAERSARQRAEALPAEGVSAG